MVVVVVVVVGLVVPLLQMLPLLHVGRELVTGEPVKDGLTAGGLVSGCDCYCCCFCRGCYYCCGGGWWWWWWWCWWYRCCNCYHYFPLGGNLSQGKFSRTDWLQKNTKDRKSVV